MTSTTYEFITFELHISESRTIFTAVGTLYIIIHRKESV